MRRTPRKGKDDPISSSPGGKSPLDSALVGAVAGSGNGLLGYARACPAPPPTTDARSNEPKVGFKELSDVTADDLDLGAEASSSNEGFRCPSMGEMYVNCREFMLEAKRQGAGEFLVALAALTLAFHFIGYMNDILVAELNLQAPKASDVMDRFWNFYETHPILCLSTNFGIAILLGTAFLYLEELKDFFSRLRDRAAKQKYGYHELDEQNEELPNVTRVPPEPAQGEIHEHGPACVRAAP